MRINSIVPSAFLIQAKKYLKDDMQKMKKDSAKELETQAKFWVNMKRAEIGKRKHDLLEQACGKMMVPIMSGVSSSPLKMKLGSRTTKRVRRFLNQRTEIPEIITNPEIPKENAYIASLSGMVSSVLKMAFTTPKVYKHLVWFKDVEGNQKDLHFEIGTGFDGTPFRGSSSILSFQLLNFPALIHKPDFMFLFFCD